MATQDARKALEDENKLLDELEQKASGSGLTALFSREERSLRICPAESHHCSTSTPSRNANDNTGLIGQAEQ